ncbi:MAG: BatA and WFA domain-containing protein [Gemmatimonadota bacterium]
MIGFTSPWLLLGLFAAVVPILLHLVQRREPPEVAFPAVRYLEDATRDHRRRVKLRHLLLLLLRTLVIVALVLAAAGMTLRGGVGRHAPSALVLVLDNSASSGVVSDGEPLLTSLIRSARAVLARATVDDRLWLVTADGNPHGGSATELAAQLDATTVSARRLDLGTAVRTGRDLVRGSARAGEVVVVSDLQRSALGGSRDSGSVLVLRPTAAPPGNRSVSALVTSPQPWGVDGGRVTFTVASADSAAVAVSLAVPGHGVREILVTPGMPTTQRIAGLPSGWSVVTVSLPPDELRADDARSIAIQVAPPPSVHWDDGDRFVSAAMEVLRNDSRVRAGEAVRFGALGGGASVVQPPADLAQVGALNRSLAGRGIGWQYGVLVSAAVESDSGALLPAGVRVSRRVTLVPTGAGGETLVTVSGEPWLVQSGDVLLLGSRLDTAWTALPLSAPFLPFLDAMVSRASRGVLSLGQIAPGEALRLPERVTAVVGEGGSQPVEGGAFWRPAAPGVYHLTAGGDTLGAVTVAVDARESDLARAPDGDVRALWGDATVASLDDGPSRAFTAGSRGDLRGLLLLLALCCALAETGLAGRAGRRN